MDSKRLTDERLTDERVKDLLGFLSDLGCSIIYQELRETCDIIVALRELLLLRADAAELARALQSLRTCSAVRQSKMCGQCDGKADELLSRPSVVNLLKEKDQ